MKFFNQKKNKKTQFQERLHEAVKNYTTEKDDLREFFEMTDQELDAEIATGKKRNEVGNQKNTDNCIMTHPKKIRIIKGENRILSSKSIKTSRIEPKSMIENILKIRKDWI